MDIINLLKSRYTTKVFDKDKKISSQDMDKLMQILNLSASSLNLQPWHFIIAQSDEAKAKLVKAATGMFAQNEPKILNSSAVIIFSCKLEIDNDYLIHVGEKEEQDHRYKDNAAKDNYFGARVKYRDMHRNNFADVKQWCAKQAYLNLGNFLVGAASLGIDSCTMEGLDMAVVDEEFGLISSGYGACFAVAVGYRSADDFNDVSKCPKSRLDVSEIIKIV